MQADRNDTDDLEYLSRLGFEKTPVSPSDLDGLVKKIRTRSVSYNSRMYYSLMGLLIGVVIGLSLFFLWLGQPLAVLPSKPPVDLSGAPLAIIELPAVSVLPDKSRSVKENFMSPHAQVVAHAPADTKEPVATQQADSVMPIPAKPVDATLFNREPLKENKLKFFNNAPIVYIHDLKVTNYALLYFRNNRFVKWNERTGLSADYSTRQSADPTGSQLKQSPDYFLHEELAQALLYFNKGNYDACIQSLNSVATYNSNDVNCDFYLGMCYYYKHNYTKAITLFDDCIINLNNTFLQEAAYYKAVALFDSGNTDAALAAFKQIAEEEGFYAEKANGYLK